MLKVRQRQLVLRLWQTLELAQVLQVLQMPWVLLMLQVL